MLAMMSLDDTTSFCDFTGLGEAYCYNSLYQPFQLVRLRCMNDE